MGLLRIYKRAVSNQVMVLSSLLIPEMYCLNWSRIWKSNKLQLQGLNNYYSKGNIRLCMSLRHSVWLSLLSPSQGIKHFPRRGGVETLTQDQTVPGDSPVRAASNVQRIQQCLWLIILLFLPSPADFVQVFYGYLETLENRQKEDFANFFCLGLWIPYTDGEQPNTRLICLHLPKERMWTIFSSLSPNTIWHMPVVKEYRESREKELPLKKQNKTPLAILIPGQATTHLFILQNK